MRRFGLYVWLLASLLVAAQASAQTRSARALASHAVGVSSHEEIAGHLSDPKINLVVLQRGQGRPLFEKAAPIIIDRVRQRTGSGGSGWAYFKLPAITKAADLPQLLRDQLFAGNAPAEVEPWIADMLLRAQILESVSGRGHINTNLIIQGSPSWHGDRGFRSVVTTDLGPGTLWKGDGVERQADTNDLLVFRGSQDQNALMHSSPNFTGMRLTTLLMDAP